MLHNCISARFFISIHSLRVEGDCFSIYGFAIFPDFNPLPPCGGRHFYGVSTDYILGNFNPLPPCGGRLSHRLKPTTRTTFQSTPSVWRETRTVCDRSLALTYFNPLPPCGGRLICGICRFCCVQFQSTPSVWRETEPRRCDTGGALISIHSLRVEGDIIVHCHHLPPRRISIHSLRVEGDNKSDYTLQKLRHFNPLPPCGGRRCPDKHLGWIPAISIHSLRVEGDVPAIRVTCRCRDFNPLPPCGGRPEGLSAVERRFYISIHSLRVEGDTANHATTTSKRYFNPLPPCGGRRPPDGVGERAAHFNPLPPCGGRQGGKIDWRERNDFNPLPPCGGRQSRIRRDGEWIPFQSTPSVWRETVSSTPLA